MLRVLSITSGLCFGGDERRLLLLAQQVDRRRFGHIIVCICDETSRMKERQGSFRAQFEATRSKIIDLNLDVEALRALHTDPFRFLKEGATSLWRCVYDIQRVIKDCRIDVIDAHVGLGNRIGMIAGLITHTPVVLTLYDPTEYRDGPFAFAGYQFMLPSAAGVITDDEIVRRKIETWALVQPKRLFVIPSSIPAPEPTRSRDGMLRDHGLNVVDGTRVVGMVANLLPFKGQMLFLQAAAIVARSHPEAVFVLAGFVRSEAPASYVPSLLSKADELGIAERVRIVSHPGPIGDVWQLIDIFVHPSMRDSMALSIIEAMALGKPSVVSDVGGTCSLVVHEQTGLVVPTGDIDRLAEGITRLLECPDLAKALGDAALTRYASLYSSPEKMTSAMEEAFLEAARA